MKYLKHIISLGVFGLFIFLLLYGYIAIAGVVATGTFKLFSWIIPKNYWMYIIVETVIAALISGALFGVLFGYFFSNKTVIFAFLVSGIVVVLLYYNTHVSHWKHYVDYMSIILFFVSFSLLGSLIRKRLTSRLRGT